MYSKGEGVHQGNTKVLNNAFRNYYDNEKQFCLNIDDLTNHLQSEDKSDYIFYTNSCWSHFPLFVLDVDCNEATTAADIKMVLEFLLSIHPDAYW